MPLINAELYINRFYEKSLSTFISEYELTLLDDHSKLHELNYPHLETGMAFCCSKNIKRDFLENCIVVGGPCVKDCINSITIEAIYEIINVILMARALNSNGIIFLGLEEEIIQYGKGHALKKLFIRLKNIINSLIQYFSYNNILTIDTSEKNYNCLMAKKLIELNKYFHSRELNTIFEFGYRPYKEHNPKWIEATKRVIIAHTPHYLKEYLNLKYVPNILAVENVQQIKIIKKAFFIEKKAFKSEIKGPLQIVHLPVPGISGANRLYRAPVWDKVFIDDSRKDLNYKQALAPEEVKTFWKYMFTEEIYDKEGFDLFNLISTLRNIL